MSERDHLLQFVKHQGGVPKAASTLNIPYSTLASICNGYRGISKAMAKRIATASNGELKEELLVWIRSTREAA